MMLLLPILLFFQFPKGGVAEETLGRNGTEERDSEEEAYQAIQWNIFNITIKPKLSINRWFSFWV
jgi:hypothetical protein